MIYYLWLLHLWNDWLVGALIELLAGIPSSACPWIPVLQTSPMTQFQRLTRISTQVFNSSISKRMIEEAKHQDKKESQNYWVRRWGVGWERERENPGERPKILIVMLSPIFSSLRQPAAWIIQQNWGKETSPTWETKTKETLSIINESAEKALSRTLTMLTQPLLAGRS